ncbi:MULTISPECIES: radical SAM protein [Ignavibacterium]|jgi:anaerobic magnesium-protoporphyrin IX monomethyl ester cyclase|uniref:B12-binding domain-containing radical SAM protein n=1 Tax=Ignavibacterium TaxID=795750 RepID=UPI0025C0C387|nr:MULTISPECIES: radical SAM protein [Ignavibacterium]MBI5662504.1 B12-binding domain-containing radical SAM protein [Ignavibacterium album]
MKKILFTHSYFYKFDPKQWKTRQPYPPLATITAASFLRLHGYEVGLFDTSFKNSPEEINQFIKSYKPEYLVIYDDGFNYLTKMCLTNMREAAFEMIKAAKENKLTAIVSSSDATDHYEKYINAGADYIIIGEAEHTLKELLDTLNSNPQNISQVDGIIFKNGNQFIRTKPRQIERNLDVFPMAAWDLININDYKKIWTRGQKEFSLNIATTRGCPFKCNWCAKPIYGNRYNSRSAQNVINEIEYLQKKFGVNYFWFCDDIFGLKPGWVQEFRDLVKQRKLIFRYKIQSRVDLLLKEDTVEALAESGADIVWVGAESGSQKILDAMDKGTTVDEIYKATRLLKSKNIKVAFFLQFGYLNETREDIEKTINMVLDLMPDEIGISVSYPLPGTKFYEIVKEQLKEKTNWTDSDDLSVMFRSTFHPAYYKKLHRYVHKVYKKKTGIDSIKKIFLKPFSINKKTLRAALLTFYYFPAEILDKFSLKKLESLY